MFGSLFSLSKSQSGAIGTQMKKCMKSYECTFLFILFVSSKIDNGGFKIEWNEKYLYKR